MTYQETLDWMFVQLPMYQRKGEKAYTKDLSNIILLCDKLSNPQNKFKSIHVAGTNGKGSTSHMLASVLQEAGYKVGLYTSPHLKDFRERIKVNGIEISEEEVVSFVEDNKYFFEENSLSFFEMTVGLAFNHFYKEQVDFGIVEVGLGGRLDSTNIITPEVSVITNIGLDHVQFLGDTIEKIAFEKGGIIKEGVPVVVGEFQEKSFPVFEKLGKEKKSKLYVASDLIQQEYKSDLKGTYQKNNIKTAVQTIQLLREQQYSISEKELLKGLKNVVRNTGLLGRWQLLNENPKVVCDTAHNKEGLTYVMEQLASEKYKELHFVLGVVDDKDLNGVLPLLPKNAKYYFCKPGLPRGLNALTLQEKSKVFGLSGTCFESVNQAYEKALENSGEEDFVYVGGSTFVVSEIL